MTGHYTKTEQVEAGVGDAVRRLREIRGLSQAELAARMSGAGVTYAQQTVAKIESGRRPLRFTEAMRVVDSLDFSLDHLRIDGQLMSSPEVADLAIERFKLAGAVDGARREADQLQDELARRLALLSERMQRLAQLDARLADLGVEVGLDGQHSEA